MRRVLRLAVTLGLVGGLLSAAPPVGGQTQTIALSIVDASDTSTTITAVEEDGGAQTLQVKAVASAAVSADAEVTVTVGDTGAANPATRGATDDYTRGSASVTVTITNGNTEAFSADLTITPISDTVTEEHENIRFSGTAAGYTVSSVDLAITDQDRELRLSLADSPSGTRVTSLAVPESRGNLWLYGGVTLGGVTNDMFTASTGSTYGSQLRTDVGYQGGTQAGLATPITDYGTDYNTWDQGSHVTIAANGLSADWQAEFGTSMPIEFIDDSVVEGDEVVYLRVNPPSGFTSRRVPITIMDNDDDIGLSVSSNIIAEGQTENVNVTASFGGDSSVLSSATEVTVTLGAADTNGATPGTDFTTSGTGVTNHSFTISIPAQDVSATSTVTVEALTDANNEGVEGVAVSGSATVGGATATVTAAQISIAGPNETITLSFHEANSGEAAVSEVGEREGAQTVRVKAEAGAAVSSATTVTVTVGAPAERAATLQSCTGSGPTLICSGDYERSADTLTITIANGQTDGTADVTITPRADSTAEGAEIIRFTGSASGFAVLDADLPIAETVSLTLSAGAVGEGAGNAGAVSVSAHFYQTSSSDLTADTDVTLTFGAGENTEAADFTAPASTVTVTIPAGATSSSTSATLSGLSITQDTIAEGAESIIVGGTGEGITVAERTLSITDDDLRIELTADTDSATTGVFEKDLSEGETPAVGVRAAFASGVTNGLSSDLQVRVTASEEPTASATGGGVDFTAPASPLTLTIPTGTAVMSSWETLTGLLVTDDAAAEAAETFRITGSVSGGTVAHDTLTIGAGDDALDVSVSPQTVWERAAVHTITVTARFASATASEGERTVNAVVATGDSNGASLATSCPTTNMDACTDTATFAITIPDGSLSGSGMFDLTARVDSPEATPETVKVTGTLAGGSSGSDSDMLRIVDSAFLVELLDPADDSDLSSVGEEDGDVTVRVRVTASSADASRRVVGLNVTGGTATLDADGSWGLGEDFRVGGLTAPSGTPDGHALGVVIEANDTMGTADITITLNDDKADDDDETILVSGADVGTWPVLGDSLTITDDDDPPANIVLSLSPDEALEDGGAATVRVTASYEDDKESTESLTVPITVSAGTAAVGDDFGAVGGLSIVIDPYENSGATAFNLTPVDDSDAEGPETVTVAGGPVAGFTIPDAALTIVDDETRIGLSLLDSSDQPLTSLEEGTASTAVTVRAAYPDGVNRPAARTVRVSVGAGEGLSASDYQATGPPVDITIPAGDNSAAGTFDIALDGDADDGVSEPNETLEITGVLAGFEVTPAALTITDDDSAPTGLTLAVAPSSAPENRGNSPLTVQVRANLTGGSPRSQATSVRVTVAGGTAASGRDYRSVVSSPFTITIPALARNGNGTFTIVILNDAASEQTKRLTITGAADSPGAPTATANFAITNVTQQDPQPQPSGGGGGGGGAPPPSGGGGGGGGGGAAPPPPAQPPVAPPPPAEPVCQGRFCDDDGSVHQANIERIAGWEITLGCDAEDSTKFCPSAQITRRQMAAFLYRAVSQRWTIQELEGIEITDVPEDAWYRTFADWVVSTGAFDAPDGVFNPGGVVTRADMAVMMIASFPHISAVEEPEGLFADAAGVDPAVIRAIEGMYESGVTRGCTTDPLNYCPDNPVTRAQMASFFVRAIDLAPATTTE